MAGTVHDVENKNLLSQVKEESANAARQLAETAVQLIHAVQQGQRSGGSQCGQLVDARGGQRHL